MVDYQCLVCSKTVPGNLVERNIRCPFCSSKILVKKHTRILDPIKAR